VSGLEFIASVVASLAWPAAALILFFCIRKPLTELLPLLQRLKYKDIELDFRKRVEEVSSEVLEEVPAAPRAARATTELESIAKLAEISPRAATIEAWRSVDVAAGDAARRLGWQPGRDRGTHQAVRFLEQHPDLDPNVARLIQDLRQVRNQAAHVPAFAITKNTALEYASSAARVADYLTSLG
jgi:hypothetical protein